ncbi:MAG: DUF4834 family protein, partial [Muribaculaceae bacterium]|nr:DUF4834 family protein [Muribaculaceae bacterium]
LITLLIAFILWPLIKTAWRIWSQLRSIRRFMADPEGEMRRRAAQSGAYAGDSAYSAPRQRSRKKKIARDVGEYIDFTEVELSEEQRAQDNHRNHTQKITPEEQISDIKWVDIN